MFDLNEKIRKTNEIEIEIHCTCTANEMARATNTNIHLHMPTHSNSGTFSTHIILIYHPHHIYTRNGSEERNADGRLSVDHIHIHMHSQKQNQTTKHSHSVWCDELRLRLLSHCCQPWRYIVIFTIFFTMMTMGRLF